MTTTEPTTTDPDWTRGACSAAETPDIWHADTLADTVRARRACQTCPITTACLTWAIHTDQPWGIWGGHSTTERKRIARGEPARTPPAVLRAIRIADLHDSGHTPERIAEITSSTVDSVRALVYGPDTAPAPTVRPTPCRHGHPVEQSYWSVRKSAPNGQWVCRPCKAARGRARRARRSLHNNADALAALRAEYAPRASA